MTLESTYFTKLNDNKWIRESGMYLRDCSRKCGIPNTETSGKKHSPMPYGLWDDKLLAHTKTILNHVNLLNWITLAMKRSPAGTYINQNGEEITPEGTANHSYLNIAILLYKFSTPPYPLFILIHLMLATLRTTAHTFCLREEDNLLEGRSKEGENGGGAGGRKRRRTETEDG